MKKLLFLLLFISYPLYSQISSKSINSERQIEFFKANSTELKDENGEYLTLSNYSDSLTLIGDSLSNYFGNFISSAGDVNGDGFDDIIVGSNIITSLNYRSYAYIFYGGMTMNNIADVTLIGELNTYLVCVSSAGDVNGDGYSDVIMGSYQPSISYRGLISVFYGGYSMDANPDFTFYPNGSYSGLRFSVSTAGDVNADGFSDVIIGVGSEEFATSPPGKAFLFYGGIGGIFHTPAVTFSGVYRGDKYGLSVSSVGDVNGDGFSDAAVSSTYYNSYSGRLFIYYGGINMDNSSDIVLSGENPFDEFGTKFSSAGDVNGDGYSDVIVSSPGYNLSTGRVYIYYGGIYMDNVPDMSIAGKYKFAGLGDVNGDEYSDIIIGNSSYFSSTGQVKIYFGGSIMDSLADIEMSGSIVDNAFGLSVSGGDLNGDGYPDIFVGEKNKVNVFFPRPEIKINLKVLLEGIYNAVFNQLTRKDSVTVLLRNVNSPYDIMDSAKIEIDSNLYTGQCKFTNAPSGDYYLVVKHLNSLETWSKIGGEYFSTIGLYNYDFTSSISQAFGNNLKLKGSKFCLFSGDVTQDGYINLSDVILINNDASNFTSGNYLVSDLTGDNNVDLTDVTLCSNNAVNFVSVIRP